MQGNCCSVTNEIFGLVKNRKVGYSSNWFYVVTAAGGRFLTGVVFFRYDVYVLSLVFIF